MLALIVSICLLFLAPAATLEAAAPVVLKSGDAALSIDPATLETTVREAGGGVRLVSRGLVGAKGNLVAITASSAVIRFASIGLTVCARLSGATATFELSSEREGTITWPSVPLGEAQNLIWPMADGRYVSVKDAEWMDYLRGERDLGTGLPLWGYVNAAGTVAWVADTPYRNALSLDAASVELRQTYLCRQGQETKVLSLRVSSKTEPLLPAFLLRDRLVAAGNFKSLAQKLALVPESRREFLPGALHAYLWGSGASPEMLAELKSLGIDRAMLTIDDYASAPRFTEIAKAAASAKYLFGIYDSYHSVHPASWKGSDATWPTAQFAAGLYETVGIMDRDGNYRKGYQGKGRIVNPVAAQKYFLTRVRENLSVAPLSSYFVDCDAAGEIAEDWNPLHASTSEEIQAARAARLEWLAAEKGLVVGSEGGDALTMKALAVSEGLFGPVFYWEDADFKNRDSKYFNGAYWPPEAPKVFFKPIPIKDVFVRRYFDPKTRIPLFEAALHDSVVISNHWGADPFKFIGQENAVRLFQALYQTTPTYNLTRERLREKGKAIKETYDFLTPLARTFAFSRMLSFEWLSADRLVQRTSFEGGLEVTVNFSGAGFELAGMKLEAHSALAKIKGVESRRLLLRP